jgi:hypothetical protein
MRYFCKQAIEVIPPTLKSSQFEKLIPGWGHIATDDPVIIEIIDTCLKKREYGFHEIRAADYEAAKKVLSELTSLPSSQTNVPRPPQPPVAPPEGSENPPVAAPTEEPAAESQEATTRRGAPFGTRRRAAGPESAP